MQLHGIAFLVIGSINFELTTVDQYSQDSML